jgi:hypothetical protein
MVAMLLVGVLAAALVAPGAPDVHSGQCARLVVPGAARVEVFCLTELTTAGTVASGHTVPADWAGLNHSGLPQPVGVPGIQVDGYFQDSSTGNTNHGWNHDSQFVIRLPDRWNGGLVVSGSPGVRRQYANDRVIADQVLARGYAFAATDKGNVGADFYRDGTRPGDAILEWHHRLAQLTLAARTVVWQRYGRPAGTTLAAGLSNGGYLVRWQLENLGWLYDGGIDLEGTLWTADGPNLFTFLPPALRAYPAADGIVAAGFHPDSGFLWEFHHRVYWDLTQRSYREELDPAFDGAIEAGTPFCREGPRCDANYDYAARPASVHAAVRRIALTGRITRPLITLHGTLDTLLPITQTSDRYAEMVAGAGRGSLHRYYRVERANHVDSLVDAYPTLLRPLAPCLPTALTELAGWLHRRAGATRGCSPAAG